jgi:hypothetical protein
MLSAAKRAATTSMPATVPELCGEPSRFGSSINALPTGTRRRRRVRLTTCRSEGRLHLLPGLPQLARRQRSCAVTTPACGSV